MTLSNFFFRGTRVDSNFGSVSGIWHPPSEVSVSQSQDDAHGGYGAVGVGKARTSYSSPLGSIEGDSSADARMMRFSAADDNRTGGDVKLGYIGGGFLNSAAGGTLYPITVGPSSGNYIAQSVRAFLRLDGSNLQRCGSSVNLILKAKVSGNGSSQYTYESSHNVSSNTPQWDQYYGLWSGYQVGISSLVNRNDSDTDSGFGRNGNPVLRFASPEHGYFDGSSLVTNTTDDTYYEQISTNSFSYNTWYHIRMDLIPQWGADMIKIYTAPVSGAGSAVTEGLGSETWTLDMSILIPAGAAYHHPIGKSSDSYTAQNKWAGYTFSAAQDGGTSPWENDCHDASIDSFQFLTKDIS